MISRTPYEAWIHQEPAFNFIAYNVFDVCYILNKVEIWTGVTYALLTDSQTLKDRATQLL